MQLLESDPGKSQRLRTMRLRFVTDDGAVDIDEAKGWSGLLDALPRYLPGSLTSQAIFEAVALPPFATNTTEIYSVDHNETVSIIARRLTSQPRTIGWRGPQKSGGRLNADH